MRESARIRSNVILWYRKEVSAGKASATRQGYSECLIRYVVWAGFFDKSLYV